MRVMRVGRLALASFLVVMLLPGSASSLATASLSVTLSGLATSDSIDEYHATIDERFVAWEEDGAIRVKNLATNQTRTVTSDGGTLSSPDVCGEAVVYEDDAAGDADVMVYVWSDDTSYTVANSDNDEVNPRIDGSFIVWQDDDTNFLWYWDNDVAYEGAYQLTFSGDYSLFDVDNGRVAMVDPSTDAMLIKTLRRGPDHGWTGPIDWSDDVLGVQLHGDRVALTLEDAGGDLDAAVYNIASNQYSPITSDPGVDEYSPAVFHDTFAWSAGTWGFGSPRYLVPGYSTQWPVLAEPHQEPSLYGRRMGWTRGDDPTDWDAVLATSSLKLAERTAGTNRYATAVAVSKEYFAKANNVILCTGENFPDALAAAPLSRALQAPLLLTRRDSVPSDTLAELSRLGAKKVYLIGGTPTISAAVATAIDALPGVSVERIAGANRYETSAKIALKLLASLEDADNLGVWFTRGDNFPDALAVGPIAANINNPILLVQPSALPSSVAAVVDAAGLRYGIVVGDANSVGASTKVAIDAILTANGGVASDRIGGANRYETAARVVQFGLDELWVDLDTLGVAVGTNFPDALAAGAALGYYGSPILLTSGTSLSPATSAFLTAHGWDVGRLNVFGSTSSVNPAVMNAAVDLMK